MEELITYRKALLAAMENIVDELTRIVKAIPVAAWHQPNSQESNTPYCILARMRELEAEWFAVQLPRFQHESTPVLPVGAENGWIEIHSQPNEAIGEIVDEISNLRKHELTWLRTLSSEDWSRTARHPWYGVHTLQWWVEHQLDLSRQYLQELASVPGK